MVSPYLDRVRAALKVVAPLLKAVDDREEFFIVDRVVEFRARELLRTESDRVLAILL